ncbi:X-Pro dipeptidyl-peptidase C-terminal non-catalytic domain-containing protein [Winogradskyella thalassocola]|uniref:X-Pro dipeptidyl-peptidase C-terminal non-catalytic domain-containing protein n=1 Tax=Winogradskyella thalassocola TaxID=262004 RepID=A0A1G8ITP8_9FLAO|nr:X-Pro dipeptidyl-peptidase C-terminal non-catalytic domain-containing protein [Winogradskyella thalassocola]
MPWQDGKDVKITDNIITRGWADPKNHKSLTKEENLVIGKDYTITFDLQPDDQIIKAGQQIGFMIFSSDKEFTLHPKAGTELMIHLGSTKLTLPIVGGINAFKEATN